MRKKIFSIWSILLVLVVSIALLVPGCAPTTGTIEVKATLDGSSWTGAVQYTLTALTGTGAGSPINGTSVDASHRVDPGIWACAYVSGGPAGASFVNISVDITLTGNQTVIAGGTVTFTLNFVAVYDLTMAVNPVGGGTATDLTGASLYAKDTAVDIKAVAADCYRFVDWDATAGTLANANAAETTFTMPARDVTVTANFEPTSLDHFKGYAVTGATYLEGEYVTLNDQFVDDLYVQVEKAEWFCNPVEKLHDTELTPISNPDHHFTVYSIYYGEEYAVMRSVEVSNQFGTAQNLSVVGPFWLAVPTQKDDHEKPVCLDHFLLYAVMEPLYMDEVVDLTDQFGPDKDVVVYAPYIFANPVQKTHDGVVTEIENPDEHLVFYSIDSAAPEPPSVQVVNQFEEQQTLDLTYPDTLAVPSEKIVPPAPPLDHFKCYVAEGSALEDVWVGLEDQFDCFYAQVLYAEWFCNPVEKLHDTVLTPISNPDHHLTVYAIYPETDPQYWDVVVDNQFGTAQELTVWGPFWLAVPTQKLEPGDHDLPKYLDHFLVYEVIQGSSVSATVDLDDQFPGSAPGVTVATPIYFANPALKGHLDYIRAPWNPDEHLVFYEISSNPEFLESVVVNNQFEQDLTLPLSDKVEFLAVPSEKIYWEPLL